MTIRTAAWITTILALTALPSRAEQSVVARGRAAEVIVYGWVVQASEIRGTAPAMVKTDKGFSLDRGKPTATLIGLNAEGTMKGKLAKGPTILYLPIRENDAPMLFFRGQRLLLFARKMTPQEAETRHLAPGSYLIVPNGRDGLMRIEGEEGRVYGTALEAAMKVDAITKPDRRAQSIAEQLPTAEPLTADALFELLAEIDPEPAVEAVLEYLSAHPAAYAKATLSLALLDAKRRQRILPRLLSAREASHRALAASWLPALELPNKPDQLQKLAADPDELVRESLAKALPQCDAPTRKLILEKLKSDPSPKVKAAAEAVK